MMFYLYLDHGFCAKAETVEEAREQARLWFIKALQQKDVEFNVEDDE